MLQFLDSFLVDAIKEYKWALKGPTATPIGTGFRSVNVALRQQFATYDSISKFIAFVIATTLCDISGPIPSPGIKTAFIKNL